MPSYELSLIIKAALKRPELTQVIRRTCESVIEKGGIIRSLENLGLKQLPYKMSSHGNRHTEGNYVLINFHGLSGAVDSLKDGLKRDVDIVRPSILRKEEEFVRPCTKAPCVFGEMPNPDHERRVWRRKTLKRVLVTRREKEKFS